MQRSRVGGIFVVEIAQKLEGSFVDAMSRAGRGTRMCEWRWCKEQAAHSPNTLLFFSKPSKVPKACAKTGRIPPSHHY